MKITVTVDLTDKLIKKIVDEQSDLGVTAKEVEEVITRFLNEEVGTEKGLLMLIDNVDLFNY